MKQVRLALAVGIVIKLNDTFRLEYDEDFGGHVAVSNERGTTQALSAKDLSDQILDALKIVVDRDDTMVWTPEDVSVTYVMRVDNDEK